MALEEVFVELKNNLYRPLLFFIPKSLIPESKKELLDSPEFAKYFNIPAIIEKTGQSFQLKSNPNSVQIMEKPSILEGNIFVLSDQKSALEAFQFNVLLEKYLEQLKFCYTISGWMAKHIQEHCEIKGDILGYFQMQDSFFQQHLREINAKFNVNGIAYSAPTETLEHIEKELGIIKTLFTNNEGSVKEQEKGDHRKPTKRKSKPVLVTDEEARSFLLTSVFNVEKEQD